jgi:hypothetical protein
MLPTFAHPDFHRCVGIGLSACLVQLRHSLVALSSFISVNWLLRDAEHRNYTGIHGAYDLKIPYNYSFLAP